jgi:hypothetical protein
VKVFLVAMALVASARTSEACIPFANKAFVLDPTHAADVTPPAPITVCDWFVIGRRDGDEASCGASGTFWIQPNSTDDATPADQLGYVFHVVGEPEGAPVKLDEGTLYLGFAIDSDVEVRDVSIQPVDLNGNRGRAARCTMTWKNPHPEAPEDSGGCASTRDSGWLIALAIALLAVRRRPLHSHRQLAGVITPRQ